MENLPNNKKHYFVIFEAVFFGKISFDDAQRYMLKDCIQNMHTSQHARWWSSINKFTKYIEMIQVNVKLHGWNKMLRIDKMTITMYISRLISSNEALVGTQN